MWQFSETIDGLAEACTALGTPITGGNVSFLQRNSRQIHLPHAGHRRLRHSRRRLRVLKIAFRNEGDLVLLLDGDTSSPPHSERSEESAFSVSDARREFSSSEYSKAIAGIVAGEPPAIDLAAEKRLQDCLVALPAAGAVHIRPRHLRRRPGRPPSPNPVSPPLPHRPRRISAWS